MREANQTEIKMARAILEACKIHQESYDQAAADAASEAYDTAHRAFCADPQNEGKVYYGLMPDYAKFYILDLDEACEQACAKFNMEGVGRVIYLALEAWWNDTTIWAEQVLDPTATCVPTLKACQHGTAYVNNPPVEEDVDPEIKWACQLCKAFYELSEKKHEVS